jgi:hypothetical protein
MGQALRRCCQTIGLCKPTPVVHTPDDEEVSVFTVEEHDGTALNEG